MDSQLPSTPEQMPHPATPSSKIGNSKLTLFGLLSVLVIAGLLGTGYIIGSKKTETKLPQKEITKISSTPAVTQTLTPIPPSIYKDPYLAYSVAYPKTWAFRHTYGPDVEKLAPTDIVSGFDLTYNTYVETKPYTQATIVVSVLDAHNLTDIQAWINTYDLNYPKTAEKTLTTFHNIPALRFTNTSVSLGAAEYIYFISGKYAYRISIAQKGSVTNDTRAIANSFQP